MRTYLVKVNTHAQGTHVRATTLHLTLQGTESDLSALVGMFDQCSSVKNFEVFTTINLPDLIKLNPVRVDSGKDLNQ